jgi:hypothetical protein
VTHLEAERRDGDEEAEKALIALGERYLRVNIEKAAKLPLHERLCDHLAISIAEKFQLYVICLPEKFELWSKDFRTINHQKLGHFLQTFEGGRSGGLHGDLT